MAKSKAPLLEDRKIRAAALEFAARAAKCGLWAWDLDSNEIDWSREAAAILGVPEVEPSLEGFLDLLHPDDVLKGRMAFTRAVADGSPLHLQIRRTTPEGDFFWLDCYGMPLYEAGVARQLVGAIRRENAAPREEDRPVLDNPLLTDRDAALTRLAQLREELAPPSPGAEDFRRRAAQEKILETLLSRIVLPDEAKRDATALIERFESLLTIIQSPPSIVATVAGVDDRHLLFFDVVRLSIQSVLRPTREPVQFESKDAIVSYLRVAQAHMPREQMRVIFLDRSRHIICDEVIHEGTVDHAPVYVREILKRALELSASSLILAHNHPSGSLEPSFEDILTTQQIIRAAAVLGIDVDDHIIMTRHGHASLRELNFMEAPESE